MKKVLVAACLICTFSLAVAVSAEEVPLSLDEAVAIALRDNRDILLKAEEVRKAKAKIQEAQAGFWPTLTFSGGWMKTRGYYSKDISQSSTQTTVKQYLYRGGKTISTLRYNGYNFEAASAVLDKTKLEVALSVKKAFYALLLARELTQVNRNIVENTREHLAVTKKRYAYGQSSHSDILAIQNSLKEVEKVYELSLNQAESAGVLLNNLLFLDKETMIAPEEEFAYEPKEIAYDEAFLKAMGSRPEIRQYENQIKAARQAIEIAKADTRPSIYASWDYYTKSHIATLTGLNRNWNDHNIIGLTFSWPVFDGFAAKAKVEQAMADVKEAQLLKEKTVNDIALELKNSYIALKDSIAKINFAESDEKVYSDTLATAKQRYEKGIASTLDISDAYLKHAISLFNRKEAIYDYLIAKSSFEKAAGGM